MEVLCYKRRRGWLDTLIRWWTWGPYSHVELRFSDGMCFSSSWLKQPVKGGWSICGLTAGTRFKWMLRLKPRSWDRFKVVATPEQEQAAREWCQKHRGLSYDLLGVLGFVLFKNLDDPKCWYCSEICARALTEAGIFRFPKKLSPNFMARIMRLHPDTFIPPN